jgi:hypothetical protein
MMTEEQTDNFRRNVASELYYAVETANDNFTAQLFRLMMKADALNRLRLSWSYPIHMSLLDEWRASGAKEFYAKYGVGPKAEKTDEDTVSG